VAFFSAYPAIQFHERHFFHLNLITIAAACYLVSSGLQWARAGFPLPPAVAARRALVRIALFFGVILVLAAGPLAAARAYQTRQIDRWLAAVEREPRADVVWTETRSADLVRLAFTTLPAEQVAAAHPQTVRGELLAMHIGGPACSSPVSIGL